MSGVIVDTSVWISYFKGGDSAVANALDYLITGDEVRINDVIRSELLPAMEFKGETELAGLIHDILSPELAIDWEGIRSLQLKCLRKGINKVGLPDLIIAQQAINLGMPLFSLDKHFKLISEITPLVVWPL